MYSHLLSRMASLQERTARFRRVVLHLHSPDSHDWGRDDCDRAKNDRSALLASGGPARFIQELRPCFDLVAVTDHMKCGYACKLSQEVLTETDFAVLPGMEVNFRPPAALGVVRMHLTVILPQGSTPETFARLFYRLEGIPNDKQRTGQEEISGIELHEWVKRVHDEHGICIAAHVDSSQGVRRIFRQTSSDTLQLFAESGDDGERGHDVPQALMKYLLHSGLDAVEVDRSKDAVHYNWVSILDGKPKAIPTILTSDPHCVEDFNRPKKTTHIKMTQLGLQGLKDALAFSETRVRFPETLSSPPSPRLVGIEIQGGDESFFRSATVALSCDLTCVIGARGSGKSTLVEALRYVFGYNGSLDELDKKLGSAIRELQGANLRGCLLRVLYKTVEGDVRVIEATFDPKSDYATKVFSTDGDYMDVADVEKHGAFPLRLFGWSEIETLGRSPARQRDLLDRLVPELKPVLEEREEIRRRLRTSRGDIEKAISELTAAYDAQNGTIRRYAEFKRDFDKLNRDEVKLLFATLDAARARDRVLTQMESNTNGALAKLGDPSKLSLLGEIDGILNEMEQDLRDWWFGQERPLLKVDAVMNDVRASVQVAVDRLRAFLEQIAVHRNKMGEEIRGIEKTLREQFAQDSSMQKTADLRANAEKRLRTATILRKNYLAAFEELKRTMGARASIAKELEEVQNQIAGIRVRSNKKVEDTLNEFLSEKMRVSIQFAAGRDTSEFEQKVTPLLTGIARYKVKRLPEAIAAHFTPVEFSRMLGTGRLDGLLGKHSPSLDETEAFGKSDLGKLAENTTPFQPDEHADIQVLVDGGERLRRLLDLQEVAWDDLEMIMLNEQPVNETSPGQRSSAMLPLIALAEKTPLVIDQPEDNLDKRLIGNVLVKVLARLKEQRQIIVCTHDPNILVGGDAEQVVVLDAESDRHGRVLNHGSIDNEDIVDIVIDLLEGGREAFEARRRRYRERISS